MKKLKRAMNNRLKYMQIKRPLQGLYVKVCGGFSYYLHKFIVQSLTHNVRIDKIIVRGDRMTKEKESKKTITATELKQNLGMYLDRVMNNHEVVITKNGQRIACLVPYVTNIEHYLYLREEALDYTVAGRKVSYEEFMEISEKSDLRMEFINGEIFLQSSPSIRHQRISGKLYILFSEYLQDKPYQVFYAPFDVHLFKEKIKEPDVVQPDLLIACDIDDSTPEDQRYMGIPTLVVEILSPVTRRKDMAYKLNSYMLAGVKEYWIVDPKEETVMVYSFQDCDIYKFKAYETGQQIKSVVFSDLQVAVAGIFSR